MFLKEIRIFIRNLIKDYRDNSATNIITKKDKKECYFRIVKTLLLMVWSGVSAPFIYPIWYIFRKQITNKIYRGTSWQEIEDLMNKCESELVKKKLKENGGCFLYWLWTYGDAVDPLGRGGMPEWYGKNTFWNRFKYSAIRNPRFNKNYLDFRTGRIVNAIVVIDYRNFNYMHVSKGIGDSPDGIYFKWMKDHNNKWYFIYEDNNSSNIFYIGYTGLLYKDIGNLGGRFETSYRKTEKSYYKKIMSI